MRYKDFIAEIEKLPHKSTNGRTLADMYAESVEIWSNYACIGYCKIAMQKAGLDEGSIDRVITELHHAFDDYSIDEAEKHH